MNGETPMVLTMNHDSDPPRLALRPKDATKALGIGPRLLWSMTNRGEIPHLRLGRAVVYPVDELRRWLAERASKGDRR
jgi:predicted DNA-binding transcriptional regulator AlpA